jgi:branched-chain amino acid transport system ATP-binding protein
MRAPRDGDVTLKGTVTFERGKDRSDACPQDRQKGADPLPGEEKALQGNDGSRQPAGRGLSPEKEKEDPGEPEARSTGCFPSSANRQEQISGTLSGGEQQMLAIGRALMSEPKLLCIDEPSTGLAPMMRAEVFEKIRGVRARDHRPAGGTGGQHGIQDGRSELRALSRQNHCRGSRRSIA